MMAGTGTDSIDTQTALSSSAASRAEKALYLIVFVSGAVLMGVEIAGAKIMAPGFGTSSYVWGSIIGLFMGALAVGYYGGGMLADRKPNFSILASIVSAAGVWTLLIPHFGPEVCEWIAAHDLGPVAGPLIAAFAVFFVPSVLMGMVSPYAVKLNASSLAGLGRVAGRLYALSTFGSIVGTLLTTFLLIPMLFLSTVMQLLGITLLFIAVFGLILFKTGTGKVSSSDRTGIGILSLSLLLWVEVSLLLPLYPSMAEGHRLLHYEDSSYHEILVTEDVVTQQIKYDSSDNKLIDSYVLLPRKVWALEDGKRPWYVYEVRRWLKFNENIESGIFPYRNEYKNAVTYTDLLHLPVLWVNEPKRVMVVGGGGGVIPTQYYDWYGSQVDVAEIDGAVMRVAKTYFQVPDVAEINFKIGDGRQIVVGTKDAPYDIIFLDAYSSGGQIPFHLMTWEFLKEVKSKLKPGGVLVTNIISGVQNPGRRGTPPADLFLSEYKTLKASADEAMSKKYKGSDPLFKQVYVFPKIQERRPMVTPDDFAEYRNVIVIATDEATPRSREQMESDVKRLTSGTNKVIKVPDLLWHVRKMYTKGPTKAETDTVPVLTDNYAPLDTMYRPVKRDEKSRRLYMY